MKLPMLAQSGLGAGGLSVDETGGEGGAYFVSGQASLNTCSRWRKLIP